MLKYIKIHFSRLGAFQDFLACVSPQYIVLYLVSLSNYRIKNHF